MAASAMLGCASPAVDGTGDAAPQTACAKESRADLYTAGMAKVTPTGVRVKLLTAAPSPPSKGENAWTLQVVDASGQPLDGAEVTLVPSMPDHGHGSAVKPIVAPVGSEGKYAVTRVYLAMAGYWRITVTVTKAGVAHEAVFGFCLDG